jgi:hypothetical protein
LDSAAIFGPYYHCNGYGAPQPFPDCLIYYNNNKSFDRQLAGFGEVTFSATDRLKFTAGGRYAKMSFDLKHYADGIENFGPVRISGTYHENAFTPKLGVSFQADEQNLFYATYAKGFRPGGVNPPLQPRRHTRWHLRAGTRCRRLSDGRVSPQLQVRYHAKLRNRRQEQLRQSAAYRHQHLLHQMERDTTERLCGQLRPSVHR